MGAETEPRRLGPPDLAERIVRGSSYTAIAKAENVAKSTVSRWAEQPEVIADINRLRGHARGVALRRLETKLTVAVEALLSVLKPACKACKRPAASPRDVISAAVAVMDRTGLPKTTVIQQVAEGAELLPTDELERLILQDAATICEQRGAADLANALRVEATQ